MSLHKSKKPARGQFSTSKEWQEHHYFLRSVQIKVTKEKQGLQVRPDFTPLQRSHLDNGKHHSTIQFLRKPLKHTDKAGLTTGHSGAALQLYQTPDAGVWLMDLGQCVRPGMIH